VDINQILSAFSGAGPVGLIAGIILAILAQRLKLSSNGGKSSDTKPADQPADDKSTRRPVLDALHDILDRLHVKPIFGADGTPVNSVTDVEKKLFATYMTEILTHIKEESKPS